MLTIEMCYEAWGIERLSYREALRHIRNETVEFIEKPSFDELNDILFTVARLAYSAGIRFFPVTAYGFRKFDGRYQRWLRRSNPHCECRIRSRCKCGK